MTKQVSVCGAIILDQTAFVAIGIYSMVMKSLVSEIDALFAVNFVFYGLMISTVLLYMFYSAKNKPFSYNYYGKCQGLRKFSQGLPAGPAGPGSAPMDIMIMVCATFFLRILLVKCNILLSAVNLLIK